MGKVGDVGCPTAVFALALLLAACGGTATQQDAGVLATVDGQTLTTADLGNSVDPLEAPANTPPPTRTLVDSLIDEHLMAQQAESEGLDRDPAVTQALHNARRHVLAEAFAARLGHPRSPPTAAAIEDYYHRNPALFSERRLYSLAVFTVDRNRLDDDLLATIGHTTSVSALSQLLRQHAIRFDLQHLERSAEELPVSQLPQYSAASAGDVLIDTDTNGSTRLIQIASIELRPSSLESARPAIQRYLAQRDQAAAVDAYLARARSQARITYLLPEPSPTRTRTTPALPAGHPTIAEAAPNRDAALTALNR
jgi:peptidyl-prolyl cis-trans isomerase C